MKKKLINFMIDISIAAIHIIINFKSETINKLQTWKKQ